MEMKFIGDSGVKPDQRNEHAKEMRSAGNYNKTEGVAL